MDMTGFLAVVLTTLSAANAPGEDAQPGLVWVFFNGSNLTRPGDTGVDARVELDTGTAINDFSRVWTGRIAAPVQGKVAFTAEADNGCRVWIGDSLLIDGWAEDGPREGVFSFDDTGKAFPIRIEFFQNGGTAHMRLFWEWEGHARELIPAAAFSHTADDRERAGATVVRSAEEVPVTNTHARLYAPEQQMADTEPVYLARGPHLFIDDYLIADSKNTQRTVNVPQRNPDIPNPIVTGKEDGCFQPYMTILQDPVYGSLRIW